MLGQGRRRAGRPWAKIYLSFRYSVPDSVPSTGRLHQHIDNVADPNKGRATSHLRNSLVSVYKMVELSVCNMPDMSI